MFKFFVFVWNKKDGFSLYSVRVKEEKGVKCTERFMETSTSGIEIR